MCTSAHTCQSEATTITSATLCRQSGLKHSLLIDTVWAELDRSNFNQVDVIEWPRCSSLTDSWCHVLCFCLCCLCSYICVVAHVLLSSWHQSESTILRISCWLDLLIPSISSAEITSPYNIMSAAAGLSGVADPDKTNTQPSAFSHLNHPLYPSVCFHNSLSVLHSFIVNFNSVTVTLFQHI